MKLVATSVVMSCLACVSGCRVDSEEHASARPNADVAAPAVDERAQPATVAASTPASAAIDDEEPVRDGKFLYTRNCAGCHNDNGDGKGATALQLGVTARSFAEGHFAFGNTPESVSYTHLTLPTNREV